MKLQVPSTFGLVLASLIVAGCDLPRDNRPSILVIAVENLAFDSVSCENEEENPGFEVFCEEAIRFTHAFTPSTMNQSSLSSVLTGLYPTLHGVHDNGADHLSARFRTAAEAAVDKGYRTIFVSGGPPIFRKSGLAQGFELFDDGFDLNFDHYYRPVSDVFSILQDWMNKESGSAPVFAFTFLADLQFPDLPTFTQAGEMRETTIEAQLQEVGEGLQNLIEGLKKSHRWDSTHVVLMGLSGGLDPSDLKSDNTQVALFIKPARRSRDSASHWTVDRNVSLVDVGMTLFSILGERIESIDNGVLEKTSLRTALNGPDVDWRDDRIIYSEAGWNRWRLGGSTPTALRQKQFLFITGKERLAYNSLVDHMESTPLTSKDPLWTAINGSILAAAAKLNSEAQPATTSKPNYPFELGRVLWAHKELTETLDWQLEDVLQGTNKDPIEIGWWGRWALEHEDWNTLGRLGLATHNPLWSFVANSKTGIVSPIPENQECGEYFRGAFISLPSDCKDEVMSALVRWLQEKNEEEKLARRERLLRSYVQEKISDRIGQLHYLNHVKWDVRLELPRPPSLTELYLSLPKSRTYAQQINNLMGER